MADNKLVVVPPTRSGVVTSKTSAVPLSSKISGWSEYFPDQCPPADARRDTLEAYRLVGNAPPTAEDFLPTVIEFPHRQFPPEGLCIACGVSVFRKAADAVKMRARYKPLRDKRIAKGTIEPDDGLVLETGKLTHMTWWLQTVIPHARFGEVLSDVTY